MPAPSPEPTELAYLRSVVRESVRPPEIGRVTAVRTRDTASAISNHEATVSLLRRSQSLQDVPVVQPATGAALVPQPDDLVLVAFAGAEADQPLVVGHLYGDANDDRAPLAGAGDVRIRRNGATIDIVTNDNGDDIVRVSRQPTDGQPADMGLRLNLSTGEFQLGDGSGYGIESDGAGNFTWYLTSLDYVTDGSTLSW